MKVPPFGINQVCTSVTQAIAYLLYPLLGWLSDVYFTRYKVIKLAFIIVIITYSGAVVCTLAIALDVDITYYKRVTAIILAIMSIPAFLFMLLSLGMFEANAIQFGMDQLLESSSDQLSSFIHWYYWSSYAGQFLLCVINPRPEGYGTCSVIRSFVHSFIRSVHRAAEMSGRFYALVRL